MRALLFASVLVAGAPLHAETLVHIGSNAAGAQLSVDRDTMATLRAIPGQRGFDVVQVWAIYDLQAVRRDPARTERALYSFNCLQRTSNTLAYQRYRANGTRLHDWKAADLDFKYEAVKPGSLTEQAMNFVCNGGKVPKVSQPADMGGLVRVDDDE